MLFEFLAVFQDCVHALFDFFRNGKICNKSLCRPVSTYQHKNPKEAWKYDTLGNFSSGRNRIKTPAFVAPKEWRKSLRKSRFLSKLASSSYSAKLSAFASEVCALVSRPAE